MKHLHILFQHAGDQLPFGCSNIRLIRPLTHPSVKSAYRVTVGTDLPDSNPDIVIIERLWKPDTDVLKAQQLVHRLRSMGSKIVFTLDDDLLALGSPHRVANAVRLFARDADGVIVSTEPLAQRMGRLNDRVLVVPNQIDETLFGPPGEPNAARELIVCGYMGTPTHLEDLLSILEPLRRVLRRHAGRVQLELVGVAENPYVLQLFDGLPVVARRPDGHVAYDKFVQWMKRELKWDFAIAPLRPTPLNQSKSDLKYLDYAALAIPGIFSAAGPYRDTVIDGQTGLLASDPAEWEGALERMITDAELRSALAMRARDQVYAERTLAVNASRWVDAIQQITG